MHQARNEIRRIVWGLLLAGVLDPVTGWAQATATLPGAVSNMIENGEIAKVKSWLDKGGKVNARGTGDQPALMDAAAYGQLEMVRFLLAHGANPKLRDATNSTVLYQICRQEHWVNLAGVDFTAERQAAMITALIDAGADPRAINRGNQTPLIVAVRYAASRADTNLAAVRVLLERGADPDVRDSSDERTALYYAVMTTRNRAIVALILARKPDLSIRFNGTPILNLAANTSDVETVKLLLDAGADVNATDKDGFTPLMGSAVRMNPDLVKLLLSRGADFRLKSSTGLTALSLARRFAETNGGRAIIKLLIDAGATE